MTAKMINLRLDGEILQDLDLLAEWNQQDRTSLIKKLLKQAILETKIERAIKLYREDKVSIEKAAEVATLDLWSFHDELIRHGVVHPSSSEDLKEDLRVLRKHKLL